ncbi:hypothetical protein [Paenibacillus turpanensis]|uniref:hypothetical protein n=1 Tax=Paenibacillus turpanensis TaxID=2689078 RepID=UPI001409E01D|nr:hypothetical protein [Paenibacillus turpanensis]
MSSAQSSGKLAIFIGTSPNIGTTLASFAAASRLAGRTGQRRVSYLCLNLKSSKIHHYLGMEPPAVTLDALRSELRSGSLTGEKLLQGCTSLPVQGNRNLYVLFGNQNREQAEYYMPADIEHLLRCAREAFDLTIVEVNAYWDNAATICAVSEADAGFLVTTAALSDFQEDARQWFKAGTSLFGIEPNKRFKIIVNERSPQPRPVSFKPQHISKEIGLPVAAEWDWEKELGPALQRGRLLEWIGAHGEQLEGVLGQVLSELSALGDLPSLTREAKRIWFRRWEPHGERRA